MQDQKHLISIIIPIYNGASWIKRCFENILKQTAIGILNLEICVCDDFSNDDTPQLLNDWKSSFENFGVPFKVHQNEHSTKGVGFSKNQAVNISSGDFLCFQDIDDVMLPDRIMRQYERALEEPFDTIVGCQFKREPENSTARYTKWANSLTQEQLNLQVYTSHGPTVIMPTWFCHRSVYQRETIWSLRLERLEKVVLSQWPKFTIWNAGKQGRKFYNSLSMEHRAKVVAFCDVDLNKIGKKYTAFDSGKRKFGQEVDIIHFKDAVPPFVICMKIDLTEGVFENNLRTLNLREGQDYVMFS